jgi:O-antigen/teichoic acid export membrane protein
LAPRTEERDEGTLNASDPATPVVHPVVAPRFSPRGAAVVGKGLEFASQLLLVTLLPRLLGPAEFGRLTVALAIVTIVSVAFSLGAPGAFARFVPTEIGRRQAGLALSMTSQILPFRVVQLSLAGVAAIVVVTMMPTRFAAVDVGLMYLALVAEVTAILFTQVALGLGATWIWSCRIAARNAVLLLLVPLLMAVVGTPNVLWTVSLGSIAGLMFSAILVIPLVRHAERGVAVPTGAARFGRIAGAGLLAGQLTYRGPVLAASLAGLPADAVGFAGLAGSVAIAVIYAIRELFTVSVPELVSLWQSSPDEADRRLRGLGEKWQLFLIGAGCAGVLVVDRLLPTVVGAAFAPATQPLLVVLATLPLIPLAVIANPASSLRLRPDLPLRIDGTALLAFSVTAFVATPRLGATGSMVALLIALLTSGVLSVVALPQVVSRRLLLTGVGGSVLVLLLGTLTVRAA